MADTHGFEVVAEVPVATVRQIFRAAWKSGGDTGAPGVIPEFFDIPPGTAFGPYVLADGQVQIPQAGLDAAMAPDVNGVDLVFGLAVQAHVQDPPVPSATLFDLAANVHAKAPVGTIGATKNVGILLDPGHFPRSNVAVALTSGDPIAPKLNLYMAEYLHQKYEADGPTFPHTVSKLDQPVLAFGFQAYTVDVWADLYDDPVDPARRIDVSRPTPNQLRISIPIHLKIFHIRRNISLAPLLDDPMGVMTRIVITAPFDDVPGAYRAHLESAVVTVDPLSPSPVGIEGANYTSNKAKVPNLDSTLSDQIRQQGQAMAAAIGLVALPSPTVAQLEAAIGDAFYHRLSAKGSVGLWTPDTGGTSPVEVNDVTSQALATAVAIAINAGAAADASALGDFVPAGRDFAIAIDGQKVLSIIDETIHRPESEGGFGADFPPKRFSNVDDHDADLTALSVTLQSGSIHMEGDITVIDAIAGSIDVDASFTEDVGLHWEDNADGTQKMASDPGEPDVDLSLLAWILSFLIGLVTLGLVGGIIAVVVLIIVESIAQRIGGNLVRDQVTNQLTGIGAWPESLVHIGTISSRFVNPVGIEPSGIVVSGTMLVTSSAALTAVVPADAQGPYVTAGGQMVTLAAGAQHPAASYHWLSGDGASGTAALLQHSYGDDGVYVAKLTEIVNQPGGARSRSFGLVRVADTPAAVAPVADRTVEEGQLVSFATSFTDQEWLDVHEATWDWGDDQAPTAGVVTETNTQPQAVGTVFAGHAWCDNGTYTVTLTVRDDGGATSISTAQVTVLNVPPVVDAGPDRFAYDCSVLTLVATFTDPGWCDIHTATWDFGDCTGAQTAVVEETNEPPAARGSATASHVYHRCGTYLATCTVVDDDGGVGTDTLTVRVTDIVNPGFEDGFRLRRAGAVGNGWQPYVLGERAGAGADLFVAEELLIHSGERAQRIRGATGAGSGTYQSVGANPQWAYQIQAWYSLAEPSAGWARLGVDPEGGGDPQSPLIVWARGNNHREWNQLTVRVRAVAQAVTIFLEAGADGQTVVDACFDDVCLVAMQPDCPEPSKEPPRQEERCVDFTGLDPDSTLPPVYGKNGFTFTTRDNQPHDVVGWGEPVGQPKLLLRSGGENITLPFRSDRVVVSVFQTGKPVHVAALDGAGVEIDRSDSAPGKGSRTIEVAGPGIAMVVVLGTGRDLLVRVCARQDWRTDSNQVPRPEIGARR